MSDKAFLWMVWSIAGVGVLAAILKWMQIGIIY
jgi:hypothetical protein